MTPLARFEEVEIRHDLHVVTLRPSLRAAVQIERMHGGWGPLLARLSQSSVRGMHALIRASAVSTSAAEALLSSLANKPVEYVLGVLAEPVNELLTLFLAPAATPADDQGGAPRAPAKPMEWAEAYAELYRIGTGWLGWTPAETWAATPNEITQAFEGKLSYLKAIHGSAEDEDTAKTAGGTSRNTYTKEQLAEIDRQGFDPAFDREALHRLKSKM